MTIIMHTLKHLFNVLIRKHSYPALYFLLWKPLVYKVKRQDQTSLGIRERMRDERSTAAESVQSAFRRLFLRRTPWR